MIGVKLISSTEDQKYEMSTGNNLEGKNELFDAEITLDRLR